MERVIHLHGFLEEDYDDNVAINDEAVATQVYKAFLELESMRSKHEDVDNESMEEWVHSSISFPQVFVQLHLSDKEIELDEAQNNQILSSIGELDIYSEWYGYSEYTILGFNVINFSVGNHDLESILRSHIGKYAHIILNVQ